MADVKLLRPQRLTDNPDGGGLITSIEIVSGEINNLFDDISRITRVNGDLSLRKLGVVANTANVEVFGGLHVIVKMPPQDPRVDAFLFSSAFAGGWAGERAEAQAFVERYLDIGAVTRMVPYDRQLASSRRVMVYQRPELPLPQLGEAYALDSADDQDPFVFRVQAIEHSVQVFSDPQGDWDVRVIKMTTTQPLPRLFEGSEPNRYFRIDTDRAVMRDTFVSDAARYKGTKALAEDADIGDTTLRLTSVFGRIVPAAQQETSVTNARPIGVTVVLPAAESPAEVISASYVGSPIFPLTLLAYMPWEQGTAIASIDSATGTRVYAQQADGSFEQTSGPAGGFTFTADAENSRVTITTLGGVVGSPIISVVAIPTVTVGRTAITSHIPVTVGNRGLVYNQTMRPIPAVGTTAASYRALGRWYDLVDDGTGVLVGAEGAGIGLVDFITGIGDVTFGAYPDVGSSVVWAWGGNSNTEILTGELVGVVPEVNFDLAEGNAEPNTVSITWLAGAVTKTATDDGEGNLEGDGTGRVNYGQGRIRLRPTLLPDPNSTYEVEYEAGTTETELFNPSKTGSTITMETAHPIRQRSLLITYQQQITGQLWNTTTAQQLADNGAGQLVDADGNIKAGAVVVYDDGLGHGTITFNPDFTAVTPVLSYEQFEQQLPAQVTDPSTGYFASIAEFGLWPVAVENEVSSYGFIDGSNVTVQYKRDDATDAPQEEEFPPQPIVIDLIPGRTNALVAGAVLFEMGGLIYIDRGGVLYHSPSTTNGSATAAGTVSYAGGIATITDWTGGIAPALDVRALLSEIRPMPLNTAYGRVNGSPLRPGSFFVYANTYKTGTFISAQSDQNGNIESANIRGTVDAQTGVYTLAFGLWVVDAELTPDDKAEPWYDAGNVNGDGEIWRPIEIAPDTLRFNAVVLTALPLDPSIIGINPVRLPPDGRVQFIRAGDTLVIHDTQTEELATPVAGDTVPLERDDLASIRVLDANGLELPEGDAGLYTVTRPPGQMLLVGEITWADPFDIGDFEEPLTAVHTVEDMALCTDAQITGHISINTPLTHAFTADNSLVSSALVLDDVSARYGDMRALNTWTGNWDAEGPPPTSGAQYNDLSFPLELLNRDTITQRWRIQITNSGTGACNVIGEELGVVIAANINSDIEPENPQTGEPYFVLRAGGWGVGWALNNNLLFNTFAAGDAIWVGRPVQSGPASFLEDRIQLEPRWDKD